MFERIQAKAVDAKYTVEHKLFSSFADWRLLERNELWSQWHHDITLNQSHAPTPPQPSISFELSPQCNLPALSLWKAEAASHTHRWFHPLTLSLSLSLPAPLLGFPALITVCSYKNKTHCGKDVHFWQKMSRHRFIMSLSDAHRCKRIKWLSQQRRESRTFRQFLRSPFFP